MSIVSQSKSKTTTMYYHVPEWNLPKLTNTRRNTACRCSFRIVRWGFVFRLCAVWIQSILPLFGLPMLYYSSSIEKESVRACVICLLLPFIYFFTTSFNNRFQQQAHTHTYGTQYLRLYSLFFMFDRALYREFCLLRV